MFHIGHLNLLRNAKAQCDFLVVGVNSDELVKQYKSKSVIVPLAERMDIVGSIRYVDQVISCDSLDKMIAFEKVHFNRLFIGDDWKGNPRWEETGRIMKEVGVELVYLPHTQGTSSTMLRDKLNVY
jgi:glycerol-3-phosphate cytidylyltransferase